MLVKYFSQFCILCKNEKIKNQNTENVKTRVVWSIVRKNKILKSVSFNPKTKENVLKLKLRN